MSEMKGTEQEHKEENWCGDGNWGDWWRQDRVDAVGWGLFLIWAALVLTAEITGYSAGFSWWNGWAVLFIGAGLMSLAATLFRLAIPEYRRKWADSLIWGLVVLAIGAGMGGWKSLDWIWVLVLAVIGVKIVARALARQR